jgi:sugar lactone lactonase YvrE
VSSATCQSGATRIVRNGKPSTSAPAGASAALAKSNACIVKFAPNGKFVAAWGKKGSGPGEFNEPRGIALDWAGRVFVADRVNAGIQVFDPDGKCLTEWTQFGKPSGVFIDKDDMIYVADSQTTVDSCMTDPGCRRGIRVGSARDGSVKSFIPRPNTSQDKVGAEGVAADADGNVFAAENAGKGLRQYARK